jgi:succinoglycan biosynthesis transport protein ExoP
VLEIATGDYAAESFQAYEYLDHIQRRWKFVLAVCAAAGALALIVSLLLPKEYTAMASIAIDPPAGNDPRTAIAVSPVYLESLRAYEMFASSDTLFQRAVDKFHLRDATSSKTMEALKRGILKVAKIKDTKILQISVTLSDPKQAQAVAQFLAAETVALSRSANFADEQDLRDDARAREGEAQKRLEQEQAAWHEFAVRQPYESMQSDLEALAESREKLQQELTEARTDLAEISNDAAGAPVARVRARLESLEKQDADLAGLIQKKSAVLSDREARGEELQQRLRAAQSAFDAAAGRQRELETSAGLRGERLRVMDPGVVPERPSFPNVGLNVLLAMAVALIVSITFLTLTFRPLRA